MEAHGFTKDRNATLEERPSPFRVEVAPRSDSPGINGRGASRHSDEIFGRLIAVRRAALGLSQSDLAARMGTSQASLAEVEGGREASPEMLQRLEAALAAEPKAGSRWSSLGRHWPWAVLAIAIAIPTIVILSGRPAESDLGGSSERVPEAESPVPTGPEAAVRAHPPGEPGREARKETKAKKTKAQKRKAEKMKGAAPRRERGGAREERRPSAPGATLGPTSPAKPAPVPPSGAGAPQPSAPGSPSTSPEPTEPEDPPTSGPGGGSGGGGSGGGGSGGGGSGGGGSGGGDGSGDGNGPDGTGPPGQIP
jgi:transcriptional regulator with XRE-family HTH domain